MPSCSGVWIELMDQQPLMPAAELPAPLLDLRQTPIDAVVHLLQELGLTMLQSALSRTPPDLPGWVGVRRAALLLRPSSHSWTIPAIRQELIVTLGQHGVARFKRNVPPQSFPVAAERGVAATVTVEAWRLGVAAELRRRFGLAHRMLVPTDMWPVIGLQAWGDLEFRRKASEYAERFMRRNVLIDLSRFQTISFSERTFWLLLCMADTSVRLKPPRKQAPIHLDEASALLASEGEYLGLQVTGWAQAWDQWLLLEASRSWGRPSSSTLASSLATLPLASEFPITFATTDLENGPSLAVATPNKLPGWFVGWLRTRNAD